MLSRAALKGRYRLQHPSGIEFARWEAGSISRTARAIIVFVIGQDHSLICGGLCEELRRVGPMAFLSIGLLLFVTGAAHRLRAGPPKQDGEKLGFVFISVCGWWGGLF